MTKPTNLRLADVDEPTRTEVFTAQMEQSHREWRSPWPDVTASGWRAYDGPTGKPANDVGEITRRQYRLVAEGRVPWWRRVVRWVKRTLK